MTWFRFSWITILGTTIATRCGGITEQTVNTSLTTSYLNCSRKRGASLRSPTPCKYDFFLHYFSLHGFVFFHFSQIFFPSLRYHNFCIYSKLCVNSLSVVFVSIFPIFSEPNSPIFLHSLKVMRQSPFRWFRCFITLIVSTFSEFFLFLHLFKIMRQSPTRPTKYGLPFYRGARIWLSGRARTQ